MSGTMVSCVACHLAKSAKTNANGISFHRFPKQEKRKLEWTRNLNLEIKEWNTVHRLCSQHFTEDCFNKTYKPVRLRDDAVPTIIIERMKSVHRTFPEIERSYFVNPQTSTLPMDHHQETSQALANIPFIMGPSTSTHSFQKETAATLPDTPRKKALKRKLLDYARRDAMKSKKIKLLQQKTWRLGKRISSLIQVIHDLKEKNFLLEEQGEAILQNFGHNEDIIRRLFRKSTGKSIKRAYSLEVKKFAITLNFYSPKAYNYVRRRFSNCLPHPKTLMRWYASVNADPGFSKEAFNMLKLKVENTAYPIYCALSFDEMAIRQHIEYDGKKYYGYVDIGNSLQSDSTQIAKEAIVFMLTAINGTWKIPVGYFFIKSLTSEQKYGLIVQCINYFRSTGIVILSITFDGTLTNMSMCNLLGCSLDPANIKTKASCFEDDIFIFPDPPHMLKLIRNAFAQYKLFIDGEGGMIDFNYIIELNQLQETEGLHLANKLRKKHIDFFKQKMKVYLASQLLSRSVAGALLYCKDVLKLNNFANCAATAKFLFLINDAFDILNSKRYVAFGFKRALCQENFEAIFNFITEFESYIKNLKLLDGRPILICPRKTGFLGFLTDLTTVSALYNKLISNTLKYLPFYKFCQDHLELFFGSIRAQGGCNNNPTCRQFTSAFRKLLIHAEVKDGGLGNCIPQEQITILRHNPAKSPEELINETNICYLNIEREPNFALEKIILDHDYVFELDNRLTEFTKEIVIYISGFVSRKVAQRINCEICVGALFGTKSTLLNSLINQKDKGGLCYPSDDVITVCLATEQKIRRETSKINKDRLRIDVLKSLLGVKCFQRIEAHIFDANIIDNHIVLLIKAIISHYIDVRIHYICKTETGKVSDRIRNLYNKLVLFKGQ